MMLMRRSRCACDILLDRNGRSIRKRFCLFHTRSEHRRKVSEAALDRISARWQKVMATL